MWWAFGSTRSETHTLGQIRPSWTVHHLQKIIGVTTS